MLTLRSQFITKKTFDKINKLSDLAPLHNASAVSLMIACHEHLPNVINVACFDSGFHHTMPDYVKSYAIDQKIAKEKGLRKYGFHGLSYSYITRRVSEHLKKPQSETSIIALHLGSGASACAIKHGQSIDTTMGLTPVSGLPGGSRSGDIDPSLVFHYTSEASALSPSSTKDLHISTAEEILNKQSGWKALTGTTDFSKIAVPDAPGTHKLAFNIFIDRVVGYVGNYHVKLGGKVDALVFAGGIGEKSAYLRSIVVEKVSCLGFTIDEDKNKKGTDGDSIVDIGLGSSQLRTLVVETDEDVSHTREALRANSHSTCSTKWLIQYSECSLRNNVIFSEARMAQRSLWRIDLPRRYLPLLQFSHPQYLHSFYYMDCLWWLLLSLAPVTICNPTTDVLRIEPAMQHLRAKPSEVRIRPCC
jgi:acetate kinase